jgi:hypothetical protein
LVLLRLLVRVLHLLVVLQQVVCHLLLVVWPVDLLLRVVLVACLHLEVWIFLLPEGVR